MISVLLKIKEGVSDATSIFPVYAPYFGRNLRQRDIESSGFISHNLFFKKKTTSVAEQD